MTSRMILTFYHFFFLSLRPPAELPLENRANLLSQEVIVSINSCFIYLKQMVLIKHHHSFIAVLASLEESRLLMLMLRNCLQKTAIGPSQAKFLFKMKLGQNSKLTPKIQCAVPILTQFALCSQQSY